MSDVAPQLQEEPEGPRLRPTDKPNRAQSRREWRQAVLFELEATADLYPDLPEVRLP